MNHLTDEVAVDLVAVVDAEIEEAMRRLLPQLSKSALTPSPEQLTEIVDSHCTTLLVARDRALNGKIVGILTLAVFRIPTGVRAWVEDVVVDLGARGRGVGEALSREALRIAATRGARTVELTSRPSRVAANRLYQRVGFIPRETNVYRYSFEGGESSG